MLMDFTDSVLCTGMHLTGMSTLVIAQTIPKLVIAQTLAKDLEIKLPIFLLAVQLTNV
jgi:hypothetical protein